MTAKRHKHDDSCFKIRLKCGKRVHKHRETCYDENGKVKCNWKQHEHKDKCWKKTKICFIST